MQYLNDLIPQQTLFRIALFVSVLAALLLLEVLLPRRLGSAQKHKRWLSNFGLGLSNTLIVHLLLPFSLVAFAFTMQEFRWGLWFVVELSAPWRITLALLTLDLLIYCQHRLFHAVPWLWRFHQVHHSDVEVDVSTALRLHPIEIILSLTLKLAAIVIVGAPAIAVLIFEIGLALASLFNHANIQIPQAIEKWLRYLIVTPDLHRVHHSIRVAEMNSNFGFNLPWWDRIFRSYRSQPLDNHQTMSLGLGLGLGLLNINAANNQFVSLMTLPFTAVIKKSSVEIN